MNANPRALDRERLAWPVVGGVLGMLLAMLHLGTGVTFSAGVAAWCAGLALVLILAAHPIGARLGALLAGLFLAVPGLVGDGPAARAVLMCMGTVLLAVGEALVVGPPLPGLRARLAYLYTYANTHPITRRERCFDATAFLRLLVASTVLAAGLALAKAAPAYGPGLLARWLGGELIMLMVAEMLTAGPPFGAALVGINVPPIMRSPYRSASVSEFWAKRWNLRMSEFFFRKCCFAPLARHGVAVALVVPFAASGALHAAIAYVALGQWGISLLCGAFFLVQPLLMGAERCLKVRSWRPVARRAWTLAALTMVSPLFVEPALRCVDQDWGGLDQVPLQTLAGLAFLIAASYLNALASQTALPAAATGLAVSPSAP